MFVLNLLFASVTDTKFLCTLYTQTFLWGEWDLVHVFVTVFVKDHKVVSFLLGAYNAEGPEGKGSILPFVPFEL